MSTDDETPRLRRSRGVGMDSSQRRRAPAVTIEDEGTSPYDLLDRDPSAEARDLARRIRRDSDAPVTVEQVAEILIHLDKRFRRTDESAQRKAMEQIRELVTHPPDEAFRLVQNKVNDLWAIRKWVAGVLAGVVVAIGYFLWDASSQWTKLRSDMTSMQRDTEENRQDLRNLRRMNKGTEP